MDRWDGKKKHMHYEIFSGTGGNCLPYPIQKNSDQYTLSIVMGGKKIHRRNKIAIRTSGSNSDKSL